jgi:rod shape-determining protein MreD
MIQILKIALLVLGSVILQITLIVKISILGSRPDLPLALVVSVALLRGPLHGELVGFASGSLCDLFSGGPLGVQSLSRVVVGYCTGFVRGRLYSDNSITQLASGFSATLVAKIITSVHLSLLFASEGGHFWQFLRIRFPGLILAAILNSVLVVAVFWVLRKLVYERR